MSWIDIYNTCDNSWKPVCIIAHDSELQFLDKALTDGLKQLDKKHQEMHEELETERKELWQKIDEYCRKNFNLPKNSSLKIDNGVLFVKEKG